MTNWQVAFNGVGQLQFDLFPKHNQEDRRVMLRAISDQLEATEAQLNTLEEAEGQPGATLPGIAGQA